MIHVESSTREALHRSLWGWHIEEPEPPVRLPNPALPLEGWIVPRCGQAVAIEILHAGLVIRRAAVNRARYDIAQAFPDVEHAGRSGFRTSLLLAPVRDPIDLVLRAVLSDQQRLEVGTIRVKPLGTEGKSNPPLVSVVVPCYRQSQYLPDAIESALAQVYSAVEIIVVDDGSPDNTSAVTSRYPGVGYLHQRNGGLASARNAGLHGSRGEYVIFLDADDRLLPHAASAGVAALAQTPAAGFAAGTARFIDAAGQPVDVTEVRPSSDDYYDELIRCCFITCPATAMFRRSTLASVGGFEPGNDASADYLLYLRLTRQYGLHYYQDCVAEYRRHGHNMTRQAGVMLKAERSALDAQRAYVRGAISLATARRAGIAHGRAHYGPALISQMKDHFAAREWQSGLSDLVYLARFHPAGLLQFARQLATPSAHASRARAVKE